MLSADYGFFNDPGGPTTCFLAIHVKPFGAIFACVVDAKGPTPKMVHVVSEFIKMCGLVNFVYRSDKERALIRLLEDAIRESGRHGVPMTDDQLKRDREEDLLLEPFDGPAPRTTETAVPEHSHPGESRSNGAVERAVQMVEDQARTLKCAIEDRVGYVFPADHAILHWLITTLRFF